MLKAAILPIPMRMVYPIDPARVTQTVLLVVLVPMLHGSLTRRTPAALGRA